MSDELTRLRDLRQKLNKALAPSGVGMQPFVNMLLLAAVTAHQHHFSVNGVGSDAAHRALGDLYDALPDFADDLAEAYMGLYGQFTSPGGTPLEFVKQLQNSIKSARVSLPQDTELQNIIDDLLKTVNRTVYRIENLK